MIMDYSFNRKYDLHRKYPRVDGAEVDEEAYRRDGSDKDKPDDQKEAIGYSDQVMYTLKKAYDDNTSGITLKGAPIENIVRRNIETKETNQVIEAVMAKSGQKLANNDDVVSFDKGTQEFEAIMGTIHGERMLQMLREYVLRPYHLIPATLHTLSLPKT
jgi:hypothetical protein